MAVKLPPQNVEAEQSILGALLLDRDAWDQVSDILTEKEFYKPAHQRIFAAIKFLQETNQPVDIITATNYLQAEGLLESAGGSVYFAELLNKTLSSANISSYARIVREKATLRKMIHSSSQIIEKAYAEDFVDLESFLDHSEGEFYRLGETNQTEGLVGPAEVVKNSLAKIEELYRRQVDVTGLATGFTFLDKMTSGLQPGELTIIAARPSMGKTAFSLNVAQHIALRQNKVVAYFSLEMGRDSMMMRIFSSEARINMKEVRNGRVPGNAWPKLMDVAGKVAESPFYIDETSGLSPFEIRSRARRLKAQVGLDCIIIDYLQLMELKQRVENRERAVSEISKTLKAIAKELKIPVIALAQLNRSVEGRSDRRPMLSDLRESGSIEQDADVIMMLYRDDYYDKEDQDKAGHAEVIIAKQRNGPTGTVRLKFESEYGRFRDADPESSHPLPPPPPSQNAGSAQGRMGPPGAKPKNFAPGANA